MRGPITEDDANGYDIQTNPVRMHNSLMVSPSKYVLLNAAYAVIFRYLSLTPWHHTLLLGALSELHEHIFVISVLYVYVHSIPNV